MRTFLSYSLQAVYAASIYNLILIGAACKVRGDEDGSLRVDNEEHPWAFFGRRGMMHSFDSIGVGMRNENFHLHIINVYFRQNRPPGDGSFPKVIVMTV